MNPDDCIMITGQTGGRQVQLAITGDNLSDIWRALAATGAALVLRVPVPLKGLLRDYLVVLGIVAGACHTPAD